MSSQYITWVEILCQNNILFKVTFRNIVFIFSPSDDRWSAGASRTFYVLSQGWHTETPQTTTRKLRTERHPGPNYWEVTVLSAPFSVVFIIWLI